MHPRGRCRVSLSAGCLVSDIFGIFILHIHKTFLLIIVDTLAPSQKNMLKKYRKTWYWTLQSLRSACVLHFLTGSFVFEQIFQHSSQDLMMQEIMSSYFSCYQ